MQKYFTTLLFALFIGVFSTNAQIHINEWMSSNSSTITDPDFGDTGDWIELFNEGDAAVDLSGYYLSDDLGEPTKWSFPANTAIAANDFLLIWADGEMTGLHTNFKLSKDGEPIVLYNTDTLTIDSLVYSFQQTDVSMGRATDGAATLGFFPTPTPGSSNNTEVFDGLTFYQPKFSIKGGFYEGAMEVSLTTIAGEIRYTLDGSLPTLDAELYTSPIPITETTNLRARVFQPNFLGGKPATHTYFLNQNFTERALPVVSISTNPEYFWDADIGLYVQDFKPEWEYPINIELFENDGSDRAAFNELAGTKVNGQNSWELPQKMLGIYFDNEYDNNNLDYQLFFDRDRAQYDNFILRASGSDWSNTLFRDGLCQGLTTENMEIEISGFRPSIVFVNGEYMGIHNLRSRTNDSFIEDNFGYGNNEYDLIENEGVVAEGDAVAFTEWFDLMGMDLTDAANYQAVEEIMDIPNFTDYFITELWSSNSSWGHNIKTWKPKAAGTKWRWILQDLDRGFSGATNDGLEEFTTDNGTYNWARVPLRNMLENETYATQFAGRFADHLYTTFHPETVNAAITERANAIVAEIPNHVDRWSGTTSNYGDGIETVAFWENEVQDLRTFAQDRTGFLIENVKDYLNLDDAVNLGTMRFPVDAGHIEINELKIPGSPWNGFYYQNLPFELKAVPGVGQQFEGWSAAVFETLIAKESDWKYLDDGSNQGTDWQTVAFADGTWNVGQAELGYGDGDENTTVSFGNNDNDKHATTYFRKTFILENIANYSGDIIVNLKRDDGAVVYLNGVEILRSNMGQGVIEFDDYASDFIADAGESTFNTFSIQTNLLLEGDNVMAVEIHQANATSSDLSFDLELKALKLGQTTFFSTEEILSVNLSTDTFFVANFLPTGDCLLPRLVTEDLTLTIDCSPYLAPEDVTVLANVSLVVEAGVEIHFPTAASLFVEGDLQVQGTEVAPVIFKAMEGTEKWGNVNFQFSTDTSRLEWLEIVDASKGGHAIYGNAAIAGFYANLDLNHVTIDEVFGNPILTRYSNVSLKNSQLHSKITGDLVNIKYGNGWIENCDFKGNEQPDTDAIDYDEVTNGVIRNSKIYNFFGFNSDGIDLGEESSEVLIENNFIHNCTDKAISVGQSSSVFVQNNTIVNSSQGLGIKDLSTAEIDQNTFYNVAIPVACFEKNVGSGGGMAFVSNSILSNSPDAPFLVDAQSALTISNTLSDTEELLGSDNLLDNPSFENPTQQNFILQFNSEAIGSGVDDQGGVIDLGSKFHDFTALASIQISAIDYHPIDGESEFLQLYNPSTEAIDLTGYALTKGVDFVFPAATIAPNETIWVVKDATLFPDVTEQLFTWTSGKLSNGGESIRLVDGYGIVVDQVIYNDTESWGLEADGLGGYLRLISPDLDNHFAESWQVAGLVAVEDTALENATVEVFPNPTQGLVTIASDGVLMEAVEVFNLLGQRVERIEFSGNSRVDLDLGRLGVGVWILRVEGIEDGVRVVVLE